MAPSPIRKTESVEICPMMNPSSVSSPCRLGSEVNRKTSIASLLPIPPTSSPARNPAALTADSLRPDSSRSLTTDEGGRPPHHQTDCGQDYCGRQQRLYPGGEF